VAPDCLVLDALNVIDREASRAALVVDEKQCLLGLVTDGDIRRGLLRGVSLQAPVQEVMNSSPLTCSLDDSQAAIMRLMSAKKILHMPILDKDNHLVNVLSLQDMSERPQYENTVFIMAGGYGSRLHPLTTDCPKPLLRVGTKPILETIIDNFIESGFRRFIISTHYLSEMIQEYFGDGSKWGVEIEYTQENSPLGTAGALGLLPKDLPNLPIIMMNGDILTKVNFERLLSYHSESDASATVCVRQHEYQVPYGVINAHDFQIKKIEEKPVSRYYVNAGIYVINADMARSVAGGVHLDMPDLLNQRIGNGDNIMMYPLDEYWLDVGRMTEFEQAQQDIVSLFP